MPIQKPIARMLACFSLLLAFPGSGWAAPDPGEPPLEFNDRNWPPSAREGSASGVPGALDPAADESRTADDWTLTTKAAIAGDVDAAYRLGRSFAEKRGTRAAERAVEWLGRAADAGHADAMFHLSRVFDRMAMEELESGADLRTVLDAGKRDAERWLQAARQAGSLEAFASACGTAFDDEAPPRLKRDARVDCYLGFRVSKSGSRSAEWFRSKWEAVPRSSRLLTETRFRLALSPYAHLIPNDPALLETRIEPPAKTAWSNGSNADLLPLATGNNWTWQSKPGGERIVERVMRKYDELGRAWFGIETQSRSRRDRSAPRILRADSSGVHELEWGAREAESGGLPPAELLDSIRSSLVFPFPAGEGSTVVIETGPTSYTVVRVEKEGVEVQTPAGRFECMRYAVYEIDLEAKQTPLHAAQFDYAPGIGLVRMQSSASAGDRLLTEFDVSNSAPVAIR